ncbi:hypothetical protein [Slackia isoflavoniconvertens]|uniref:hypothetical protein n=1 Tax=Slackia isoflavoniconvertens TaxID=572010 RepID=UPI003AB34099
MDVSISKRVMLLFGLLRAGALMCASAFFCPNVALAQPAEASGSARIYILPFEYMDAILIESDGHFGMVDSDGTVATGWREIDGQWYFFNNSGAMQASWYDDGSSWYWFGSDGVMATGWRSIAGSWYCFGASGVMKANCWMGDYYFLPNGAMATNAVIDGYRIGPDGKWIP